MTQEKDPTFEEWMEKFNIDPSKIKEDILKIGYFSEESIEDEINSMLKTDYAVYLMRKNNPEEFEKYKISDGEYDFSNFVCPD